MWPFKKNSEPPTTVSDPRKELTPVKCKAGRKGLWKVILTFIVLIILFFTVEYISSGNESIVGKLIDSLSKRHSYGNPELRYEVLDTAYAAMDILVAPNSDKAQISELLKYLFKVNAPDESWKPFTIRVFDLKEAFVQRNNSAYPEKEHWAHHIADISRDSGKTNIFWNHWDYERNKVVADVIPVY